MIQREEQLTQRNRELCDQVIIAIKQSKFDAAIALLGTIKRQNDDPTSRKLRQFLTQIKEKRSTLIADTKRAMHAGKLHTAKTLIELYFKQLEQFGEVKDEQISGLLATVQARMKRQLFFKTAGICLLIAGIITWASSSVYEHFKLKTALAEGDYETALNIDPSNDVALKLQDRSQRIEDALKSNDFMRALRIDGSNKQAREMKLQADREAENKALAERRIRAAANIADEAIVSFPNFGHWSCRLHLGVKGRMPMSRVMPRHWYDTPNIHFCTVTDFDALCSALHIDIIERATIAGPAQHFLGRWLPNLFATSAIYRIRRSGG